MLQKGNLANTFRQLANTSFNKIQLVAKVYRQVLNPGPGPPPQRRSSHRRQWWPAQELLKTARIDRMAIY